MIVYISIGNSDDKLTQAEWSEFAGRVAAEVAGRAQAIHGAWHSLPDSRYQNACWCVEFDRSGSMEVAREVLAAIRKEYRQDSAAWAVAETEFI